MFDMFGGGKRLCLTHENYDMGGLEDQLAAVMVSIEDTLLMVGAEPGKDYTIKDLLAAALNVAPHLGLLKNACICTAYPSDWPFASMHAE